MRREDVSSFDFAIFRHHLHRALSQRLFCFRLFCNNTMTSYCANFRSSAPAFLYLIVTEEFWHISILIVILWSWIWNRQRHTNDVWKRNRSFHFVLRLINLSRGCEGILLRSFYFQLEISNVTFDSNSLKYFLREIYDDESWNSCITMN